MPMEEVDISGGVNYTEKTRAQVVGSYGTKLANPLSASFETYRQMRKHPTLALARALVAAPVIAGSWSVEASDNVDAAEREDRINFIRDQYEDLREQVMERAILGGIDFGSQPFEQVFEEEDGRVRLRKLKSLLLDITEILVDTSTGAFAGYRQMNPNGLPVELEPKYCLHIPFRVEGTQWYGTSLMENARESYNQWREANAGSERYDAKVAGAHWVVHYPLGTSVVGGIRKDNLEIAESMLDALESSGSVIVPNIVSGFVKEMSNDNPAWKIELMSDKIGRTPQFIGRLDYLDKLLVRALLMPERAVMEGTFGTKAEAGVHQDLAITQVMLWDSHITKTINKYSVDRILEWNFGPEARGTVWLESAPLVDTQIAFLQSVYEKLLTNPATLLEEFETMNTDALKDKFGVPKASETADANSPIPEEGLGLVERARLAVQSLGTPDGA